MDAGDTLLFEGFRLDCRGGCLFRLDREGTGTPVALGSRALDLLRLLVERKGELVSKDEIMKAVWPGRVVEEANLNVQIGKLRHILDENRQDGSCIRTIPGRGYCFVAPVTQSSRRDPASRRCRGARVLGARRNRPRQLRPASFRCAYSRRHLPEVL